MIPDEEIVDKESITPFKEFLDKRFSTSCNGRHKNWFIPEDVDSTDQRISQGM